MRQQELRAKIQEIIMDLERRSGKNTIETLIEKYCPEGVQFKTLREIGSTYGGLTGKSKADFEDGNARYLSYVNIFNKIAVDLKVNDFVRVAEGEKQNCIELGDVLLTGSSETAVDVGMSSVVCDHPTEEIYLNSFCFGFRLNDKTLLNPEFLKYLFRCIAVRNQIVKCANGVTRFNISKKRFVKVHIPVPPLEIQRAIVEILDTFTALQKELEAELEARKKQYQYHKEDLLTFDESEVEFKRLGEIAIYPKKRVPVSNLDKDSYVGVANLLPEMQGKIQSNYLPSKGMCISYETDDILIGNIRPYLKKIWLADISGGTNQDVITLRIDENFFDKMIPKFLYYLLATDDFFRYHMSRAKGGKMPRGDKAAILKYRIPVPPLEKQQEIVGILDQFDALVNDLSIGIPAEINARRQQLEYYQNQLLTFKEIS